MIKYKPDYSFIFSYAYQLSNPNFQIAQDAANRIFGIGFKRQQEKHLERLIGKAYDDTIGKMIPEGGLITQEASNCFKKKVAEDFVEYYLRMRKQ